MKTFEEMEYHPASEKLVSILCSKTQNSNPLFFHKVTGRLLFQLGCIHDAYHRYNHMTVEIFSSQPVCTESQYIRLWQGLLYQHHGKRRHSFVPSTILGRNLPNLAEQNLPKLAVKRANRKSTDPDDWPECRKSLITWVPWYSALTQAPLLL